MGGAVVPVGAAAGVSPPVDGVQPAAREAAASTITVSKMSLFERMVASIAENVVAGSQAA
jgi:hypothetical protein